MNKHHCILKLICFCLLILIMTGCGQMRPHTDPALDSKAFKIANQARSFNQYIVQSKGTGWISLETKTETNTFKLAWAAVFPNKIRVTFLLSGLAFETIIANKKSVTFFSHTGKHSKYTYQSDDLNMEDYVHVPIKMSELILVLLGRLPIRNFNDAYFSPKDSSLSTIILTHKNNGLTQTLHIGDKKQINELTSISSFGSLLYEITIKGYKNITSGNIPYKIVIKDKNFKKMTLYITKFLANPPIKNSVFQLTQPGS